VTLEDQVAEWNKIPPILCRFLARTGHGLACRPKTKEEIARDAGLSRETIRVVSKLQRWDGMKLTTVLAFSKGCGINIMHPTRAIQKFREMRAMVIFENATPTQRAALNRMMESLRREPQETGSRAGVEQPEISRSTSTFPLGIPSSART
jgi:hypothetical protein